MDTACQTPNVELICSAGERERERGEGFGAAEGRAGRPLWETISGILSQLRAGRAKPLLCQAGLGSRKGSDPSSPPDLIGTCFV